jgi:hypothetical protein
MISVGGLLMTKFKKIVTHPGAAHQDDVLTTAVALARHTEVDLVERRDPTDEEVLDPEVLVLDTGGRDDPELGVYDHHQFGRDDPAACALSLFTRRVIIDGVNLHEALSLTLWYPLLTVMDSKGPGAAAKSIGCPVDAFMAAHANPITGVVLNSFGSASEIRGEWLGLLRRMGAAIIDNAVTAFQRVNIELPEIARVRSISGVEAIVLESSDLAGLAQFRERHCPGTAISLSHDDRGEGWTLYRYDDDPRVDFSRLAGHEAVLFAHKGGFIAKTRHKIPEEELVELVRLAII